MDIDVKNLHPLEVRLLRHVKLGEEITSNKLISELDYKVGQCNQAFSWLCNKGFLEEKSRTTRTLFELTELGKQYHEFGIPAFRIFTFLKENGATSLPELASALSLEKSDVGSAFGALSKAKVTKMNEERKAIVISDDLPENEKLVISLIKKGVAGEIDETDLSAQEKKSILKISKKRAASTSAFKIIEREDVIFELTNLGNQAREAIFEAKITGKELGNVTAQMLANGSWKTGTFRPYGIDGPTSKLIPGRHNPYGNYLQWVKDKLCALGFEEFDGSLVENEFWNGDALFMPQFHSARDIHDVYYVKNPSHCKKIEEPWLSNVAQTHSDGWKTGSRGWGYGFDHEFTRRQIMRSQGTVLSARQLPNAKIPGKYFGVARCFRYDQVDATHGADFYQTEGIVLGDDVN